SLMDLSNRTLSGCCVSLVIGFSYFLCLNPQEDASTKIDAAERSFFNIQYLKTLVCQVCPRTLRPGLSTYGAAVTLVHPGRCGHVASSQEMLPLDSQCEKSTIRRRPIRHRLLLLSQRFVA